MARAANSGAYALAITLNALQEALKSDAKTHRTPKALRAKWMPSRILLPTAAAVPLQFTACAICTRNYPKKNAAMAAKRTAQKNASRDLYDFAPIAYVSFDRSGRIEEANLIASELL